MCVGVHAHCVRACVGVCTYWCECVWIPVCVCVYSPVLHPARCTWVLWEEKLPDLPYWSLRTLPRQPHTLPR